MIRPESFSSIGLI